MSEAEENGSGIERLVGRARNISRYAAWVSGYAVLACAVFVGIEIVARKLFSFTFQGMDEISGYVLVITFAWTAAWAMFRDAHIRIDVVSSRLPDKPRRLFDLLALASLAGVALMLAWQASGVLAESVRLGAVSNTPLRIALWFPQGLWFVGLIGFALAAVILFIARLVRAAPPPVADLKDER